MLVAHVPPGNDVNPYWKSPDTVRSTSSERSGAWLPLTSEYARAYGPSSASASGEIQPCVSRSIGLAPCVPGWLGKTSAAPSPTVRFWR